MRERVYLHNITPKTRDYYLTVWKASDGRGSTGEGGGHFHFTGAWAVRDGIARVPDEITDGQHGRRR